MKKISNKFLPALLLLFLLPACKKSFLDETVYSSYAPQTLKDSLGFEASLNGLYNHYSNFYTRSDRQGWLSVWQVGTDLANAAQQEGVEIPYYNYSLLNSNDAAASWMWTWSYRMINNANIIIKNAEDPALTGMSEAGKKAASAEARFFRALAYNTLATLYGKVPLVTEPISSPKTDFVRAPLEDVNKLIEEDLLFAAANLPDVGNVSTKTNTMGKAAGRANKYMAMQLLAEASLRMNKPAQAEQQAQAIINSGKFSLVNTRFGAKSNQPGDPFSDMFIYGNQRRSQGNREVIWTFELEHKASVPDGYTGNPQHRRVWVPAYYQIQGMKLTDSTGGRGLSRLRLSDWVSYGLYEQNDMRNSHYNFRREYWYNDPSKPNLLGNKVPYSGYDTVFRINPHTTKWYQFDPKDEFGYDMIKDIIVMRLGETYLLLAEAQFMQGKLAEAATTLNTLRARSNASPITDSQVNLDFILDERARELVGEENRRMTLMRTKTLVTRAQRLNPTSPLNPMTGLEDKHLLFPIPLSEINLNKDAVLEQNPGY